MDWKINNQTFAASDLSNVTLEVANMAVDRLTFQAASRDITDPLLFTYNQPVSITRDGKPFFSGRVGRPQVAGDSKQEGHSYEILGPWDQLERLIFMQTWKSGHWDKDIWTSGWDYKSRCVLGQTTDGAAMSIGEIISEVIHYAIGCGVSIEKGTIDAGPFVPWEEVVDITCADIIRRMARWLPGAVGWFDYSAAIPVFNFRVSSSLNPLTLTVGQTIDGVSLTEINTRSVPAVVLIYEQSNDVNGQAMLSTVKDCCPGNATGREIGAIVQTIQLEGGSFNQTVQKQAIHCNVIQDFDESSLLFQKWFLEHHPEWQSKKDTGSWDELKFKDVTIDSVTRTTKFPYELTEGTLQDWMRKYILNESGNKVLNPHPKYRFDDGEDAVLVTLSFKVIDDDGKVIREEKGKVITTKIHATDCPTGTYKKVSSQTSAGDLIPEGLAKTIYDNLNARHFQGTISISEEEVTGAFTMGNRILITGGKSEWASMSAVIQSIRLALDTGSTSIQVGPPTHLSANDMIALRRANRNRTNCVDSASRISGEQTANTVELGSAIPKGYGSSSPGTWGEFVDVWTAFRISDGKLQGQKREVHVNMLAEPSESDWEDIPIPMVEQNVVTAIQFESNTLSMKTRNIKALAADEESSWTTITTAEPCS